MRRHLLPCAAGTCTLLAIACGGGGFVEIGAEQGDGGAGAESSVLGSSGGGTPGGASSSGAEASSPDGDAASSQAPDGAVGTGDAEATEAADGPTEGAPMLESGPAPDASSFSPASLPGLALWLDANQGIAQASGSITSWTDRTANHNDATQPTASLQPTFASSSIHGLPAVHFDKDAGGNTNQGAGQQVSIADAPSLQWGTGDFYVVVVARSDNTLADGAERGVGMLFAKFGAGVTAPGVLLTVNIVGGIDTNQDGLGFSTSETAGEFVITHTLYNDGTPHAFAAQRVGATLDLRVDGVSIGTTVSSDTDVSAPGVPVQIGSGTGGKILRFDGDIAEMLAVSGTLRTADRTALEATLMAKYGL